MLRSIGGKTSCGVAIRSKSFWVFYVSREQHFLCSVLSITLGKGKLNWSKVTALRKVTSLNWYL